jgi:transposase/DNA-binding CsgD family transcriptional regulator
MACLTTVARKPREFRLTEDGRRELEKLVRTPSTPAGLSRRARAVLLMAEGVSGVEIAKLVGYTVVQVSRLRRRVAEEGISGIYERPRPGRPAKITARKRAQVVALTLRKPEPGLSHWSTREVARRAGVSHMTVHRIWQGHDLKPHRLETFKFITDPDAEERIHDVVGLYLNPPTNAVVLSFDEKTQIQALERTQPLLPLRPGLPARQTHDYRRSGITSLYAALEVVTGKVIGECRPSHTGADFLSFLKQLARLYPRKDLHVILDNSSTHSTPDVHEWLEKHRRVHLHFTPKGGSWLNLIEAWFGILTRRSLRRGSFDTVRSLVRHIQSYIDHWNENPTPFVWTKEPADIIKKALRRGR